MLSCSVGYAQLPNRPRSVASSAKDSCPIEPARFEIGLTQSSNRPNPIDQLSLPSFLIGYARFVNRTRPVANFRQQIYKKIPHIVQNPPTFYNILIQPPNGGGRCRPPWLSGPPSLGLVQSDLKSDCCEYQDLQSAKSHYKCLYSLRSDCKSDRAGREGRAAVRPPWLSGLPSLGLVQSDLKSDCCEYQDLQSAKSHFKCLYSLRSDCKSDRTGGVFSSTAQW